VRKLLTLALTGAALAGCGAVGPAGVRETGRSEPADPLHVHPQAVQPVAGELPESGGASEQPSGGSVSVSGGQAALAQPVSNADVTRELKQSGLAAASDHAILTSQGLALGPLDAPPAVQEVIDSANEIAHLPYIWGGGHARFVDTGYDCSGSLSFILASAGLLERTETSGELESYGDPGPGRWITIFANAGHTFAYIAGLRFDTVALAQTGTRWSNRPADESNLGSFVVRHPPGL
jgi:cell wall-associated NlpC family hydrolase